MNRLGTAEKAINFTSLSDEVSRWLRDAILSGRYQHGERIVEQDLATELGVSRGPIRTALRKLEIEGLVTLLPRRGARVVMLSPDDVREIMAIRAAIEPLAVRFLLERRDPSLLQPLEACLKRMHEAAANQDWATAVQEDMQFHALVYELCGQRRLLTIWESLNIPVLHTFRLNRQFYDDIEQVPHRHDQLFEVYKSGDIDRAEAAAREHVTAWVGPLLQRVLEDSSSNHA
jgi:DNA-binding GntR family transcriptional regulator